jgi:phosphoribosylformimino-5-aminoimidazole carboxamide ribotide isomerase
MLVIPAIDLRAGRAVRLMQGDFSRETVYGDDPLAVARRWRDGGAELVHVVDLDGARAGRPQQLGLIEEIAQVVPVEVGGGLRSETDVAQALRAGARRVVLGTAALDLDLVTAFVIEHAERLVIALDTRSGMVATEGWTQESVRTLIELAEELINAGVRRFLHTDVERDGTLSEPNFESLRGLIELGAPVIASGGVSSLEDIARLRDLGAEAVVAGRALYEGAFTLEEAIARAG